MREMGKKEKLEKEPKSSVRKEEKGKEVKLGKEKR